MQHLQQLKGVLKQEINENGYNQSVLLLLEIHQIHPERAFPCIQYLD